MPKFNYIGKYDELPISAKLGDICTVGRNDCYFFNGNKWVPVYSIKEGYKQKDQNIDRRN